MNILVIGQGGREHAIVRAHSESSSVSKIHAFPGNPGMVEAQCHKGSPNDFSLALGLCIEHKVNLVVVGPENFLAAGISDFLRSKNIPVFGPDKAASQLEASKVFAKEFMDRYEIPTASFDTVQSVVDLQAVVEKYEAPYVLKADGLAGGKGVFICQDKDELMNAGKRLFDDRIFGDSGARAIIEAFQPGYEISFFFLTNGQDYCALPLAQDHKRLLDGDKGPNTGGMGTVAPVSMEAHLYDQIIQQVVEPTVKGLKSEGFTYNGVVFVGLMMTPLGPKVIEYNIRFGDPETQVLLPLLDGDWGLAFSQIAKGIIPSLKWKNSAVSCIVLAAENYPEDPVKGATISGDFSGDPKSYFLHAGTRLEGEKWSTGGGRVLNAIGSGATIPEAVKSGYAQADKVNWAGMQFRKDIGKQFRSQS